jgi:hypothetical protein
MNAMLERQHLEQLKQYFYGLARERFVMTYGHYRGTQFTAYYEDVFPRIFSENEHMMPDFLAKRHGLNAIFILTIREILQREVDISFEELKEFVLTIYRNMLEQLIAGYKAQVEVSEDPWKTIVEYTKAGNQNNYDNDYFNLEQVTDDDSEFGFDIKKCLHFEIFEANGHPELGPILCEYDYLLMDTVSDWIRFERKETIADGNERCDFRLYRR